MKFILALSMLLTLGSFAHANQCAELFVNRSDRDSYLNSVAQNHLQLLGTKIKNNTSIEPVEVEHNAFVKIGPNGIKKTIIMGSVEELQLSEEEEKNFGELDIFRSDRTNRGSYNIFPMDKSVTNNPDVVYWGGLLGQSLNTTLWSLGGIISGALIGIFSGPSEIAGGIFIVSAGVFITAKATVIISLIRSSNTNGRVLRKGLTKHLMDFMENPEAEVSTIVFKDGYHYLLEDILEEHGFVQETVEPN